MKFKGLESACTFVPFEYRDLSDVVNGIWQYTYYCMALVLKKNILLIQFYDLILCTYRPTCMCMHMTNNDIMYRCILVCWFVKLLNCLHHITIKDLLCNVSFQLVIQMRSLKQEIWKQRRTPT